MNHKKEIEAILIKYNSVSTYQTEAFMNDLRDILARMPNDQPATLEVKDNRRIEIATRLMAELISGGLNIYDAKNECEVVFEIADAIFEIADAIIERGKAK